MTSQKGICKRKGPISNDNLFKVIKNISRSKIS